MFFAADKTAQTYTRLFCTSTHPSAFFLFVSASGAPRCKNTMFQNQNLSQTLKHNMIPMCGGRVPPLHCTTATGRAAARRHESCFFPLAAWLPGFSVLVSLTGVQPDSSGWGLGAWRLGSLASSHGALKPASLPPASFGASRAGHQQGCKQAS
jgi:hypothetical protein